ncbi:GntR family transcriptional regulator [Nocardioides yefusunii]|uniref:GntR family transcriptional regulator n=1 Tax=Nocardioides yefusunii TaxID=2500546 RepID=A0ABW1QS36_9ACTN|nr:GntR family transcriptional regulator [Nocardioides yefusunii]
MASVRDVVHDALLARLLAGHYTHEDSLVPQALSEEFEVSRTPVREALGLLERDGLLVSTSRGFMIRKRPDEEMLEIFEVRGILESNAAHAAATRATAIDRARLAELSERAHATCDPKEKRRLFNLFHDCMLDAAHNATVSSLVTTLSAQIKLSAPWKTDESDEGLARSLAEHDAILEAILAGDADLARARMLEHLAHDRDNRISQLVAQVHAQTNAAG